MKIKVYRTITDVDEKNWNAIVNKNRMICTHKYIKAVERSGINDCRYYYPVVYAGDEIVAHTSVYFISTELDLFAQGVMKRIINLIRRKWKNFFILRSIECGTPVALGNTISFKDGVDRTEILKLLCREIERLAKELRIGVLLFRDFYDEELEFYDILTKMGYTRIHNLPNTKIAVRWKTFDEFLNSMRSQYRWKTVSRMKGFHRHGITIEVLKDFSDYADELEKLCRNVYNQAKEYKRERLPAIFFKNINEDLGNDSAVILVKKGDNLIGFTLLFFDDEVLIPIFSGLDYNYNREYSVYFNLLYKIVDIAIERRMKDIDLGITTLTPKKEVGAIVAPLSMYMKHFNPLFNRILPKLFDLMTPQDNTAPPRVFKDHA